jgi:hypothetical protein
VIKCKILFLWQVAHIVSTRAKESNTPEQFEDYVGRITFNIEISVQKTVKFLNTYSSTRCSRWFIGI